jgi:tetratricopeptide (TPR) repeat protein
MKYFLATLVIWVPFALFAQPLSESRLEDVLDSAKARYALQDWYNSGKLYEEAYGKERDFNVALLVGFSNYQLKYFRKAESWFNRVVRRDPENNFQDARYWLAKTYKAQGKYSEARDEFNNYLDYSSDLVKKEDARKELKGIEMYNSFPENPQLSVVGLGSTVNSYYDEYSPVMDASGTLYFTSYQWKKREGLDLNDHLMDHTCILPDS